jgi:hypothetical protein
MQYKTIVLELLKEFHPVLYEQLRRQRKLLRTMNAFAAELRRKHYAWMDSISPTGPASDPKQVASQALELALEDLQEALRQEFSMDDSEPLSLDAAMAFLRRHTPPA